MKRFLDQTGIREELSKQDLPQPGSNRGYDPTQIVASFWLSFWTVNHANRKVLKIALPSKKDLGWKVFLVKLII